MQRNSGRISIDTPEKVSSLETYTHIPTLVSMLGLAKKRMHVFTKRGVTVDSIEKMREGYNEREWCIAVTAKQI